MAASAPRRDTIARDLRQAILRGTFRAGDRLPAERDLARQLGANRSSIREALRKLEQQGLVHIRHGGGATVCELERASLEVVRHMLFVDGQPNRSLLEHLLDVHEMLIVGATRLALERGQDDRVAAARALLSRLAAAETSDDEFIDAAAELLETLAEASGNWVLRQARNALNPLFGEPYRELRKRLRPPAKGLTPLIAALDAAVATRDVAGAEAAVRRLLRSNRQRALDAFENPNELPTTEAAD